MPQADFEAAESILARLIARAYVADHPELFAPSPKSEPLNAGSPAAANAVASALLANAGDPAEESNENGPECSARSPGNQPPVE
jgi:hypothetical protein